MQILKYMAEHGHEQLSFFTDAGSGLRAIIGIHDTTLGPALGGARMYPYEREEDAILDVLRLSEGMSYKAAMAKLSLGGGKTVIIGNPRTDKSPDLFRALGRAVDKLGGRYITAEDVGTTVDDLIQVSQTTDFVTGLPVEMGGGGDPSPWTAVGVLRGMEACALHRWGTTELKGRRVVIQGIGKVGYALAELLHERGVELIVTDVSRQTLERAQQELDAMVVGLDEIYSVESDIFAPCALGAILNDETIPQLRCEIVAGSANNQLKEPRHGRMLMERDILYAPDYVINAGGLINVAAELEPHGYDEQITRQRVFAIFDNVARVVERAKREGTPTSVAADREARQRIREGKVRQKEFDLDKMPARQQVVL
ncbi:MAG: leucine dehydrogenase [Chloroflexota bacterium]|nr:leucine dehydrogenase [Chloroflexota bacterium]